MINPTKKYRTPKGEIVTLDGLVEVPPVRTAEEVVLEVLAAVERKRLHGAVDIYYMTHAVVTALREAGMLKEPEADGWIKHDGGPCPVDAVVGIRLQSGHEYSPRRSCYLRWVRMGKPDDITHYRVVGE